VPGETKVLAQLRELDVVGHRVVNGGREFTTLTLITPEVTAAIEKWRSLRRSTIARTKSRRSETRDPPPGQWLSARGVSIDTTKGFTPLDGLMMGTRSGSVDPGILTQGHLNESSAGSHLRDWRRGCDESVFLTPSEERANNGTSAERNPVKAAHRRFS
jgi:hypothetical protein